MATPFLELLEASHLQWTDFQKSWWESEPGTTPEYDNSESSDWLSLLEKNRQACQGQMLEWMDMAFRLTTGNDITYDVTAKPFLSAESARFDSPFQDFFRLMGSSLEQVAGGPELADIGHIERTLLRQSAEWIALQEKTVRCQQIISEGWVRAGQNMLSELALEPSLMSQEPRVLMERWLKLLNKELVDMQRTDAYLNAQRDMVLATTAYRIHHTRIVEQWCEGHGIPTRSEVDELHLTVHQLRRELRLLKRTMTGVDSHLLRQRESDTVGDASSIDDVPNVGVRKKTQKNRQPNSRSGLDKRRRKMRAATADWAPIASGETQ